MIYSIASSQTWIGEIDAATEAEAVKKAEEKFNLHGSKLMAVRRAGCHSGLDQRCLAGWRVKTAPSARAALCLNLHEPRVN
jgi:hypothetical protein